ncbi:rCG36660 [Rattus norvegicus]|uniref:RCG36660 n=1 Tax=Rattus norvegicus TaxID=10116 RepID=A6JSC6_RAT|nr:rCG36660 [Rattus norvegicus]
MSLWSSENCFLYMLSLFQSSRILTLINGVLDLFVGAVLMLRSCSQLALDLSVKKAIGQLLGQRYRQDFRLPGREGRCEGGEESSSGF